MLVVHLLGKSRGLEAASPKNNQKITIDLKAESHFEIPWATKKLTGIALALARSNELSLWKSKQARTAGERFVEPNSRSAGIRAALRK